MKITKDNNDIAEFAYDALGRRVRKIDSIADETTRYYYNDKWQVLCEYDGNDVLQRWFAYGNYIDEVIYTQGISPLTRRYYVHDHLYSPVALVYADGTVHERYEYDAYGNCTIGEPNHAPRAASLYGNNYLFTGRRLDTLDNGSLKIQLNRNRYYDPDTGRWLTKDPLGITPNPETPNVFGVLNQYSDGANVYEYVRTNPINNSDLHGLLTCGYKVACAEIQPGNWERDIARHLGFRHCDLREGKPAGDGYTVYPVWVMAHPKSRTLQAGSGKGCRCECANCGHIKDCVSKIQDKYPWGGYWPNCHTQTKRAIDACCLNTTWKPGWFAF